MIENKSILNKFNNRCVLYYRHPF